MIVSIKWYHVHMPAHPDSMSQEEFEKNWLARFPLTTYVKVEKIEDAISLVTDFELKMAVVYTPGLVKTYTNVLSISVKEG